MRSGMRQVVLVLGLVATSACSGGSGASGGRCASDGDCGGGQTCSGGYCRGCRSDAECRNGEVCVRSGSRSACLAPPSTNACDSPAAHCTAAGDALGTTAILCIGNTELDCRGTAPMCRACSGACGESGCVGDMDASTGDDGSVASDSGSGGDDAGDGATDGGADGGSTDAGPSGSCGNGVVESGESCDPPAPGACGVPACNAMCRFEVAPPGCGNGCAEGEEECGEPGLPGCATGFSCLGCTCQPPRCGDGVASPGEWCGEPGRVCAAGKTCVDCQCTPAVCGDGSPDLGETCGEPPLAACAMGQTCNTGSCTCEVPPALCGNGDVDPAEVCGEPGLDLCPSGQECEGCLCRSECGNGEVNAGEECGEPGASCPAGSSCAVSTCRCLNDCGNFALDPGEECDPPTAPICSSATICSSSCQIEPRPAVAELCNRMDDDCDGVVDEGLVDICFDCDETCAVGAAPPPGGWMPGPTNSSGVIVDMDGALTLGNRMTESYAVWVANMDEGTVSKLDSRTGREIALYPTVGADAPAGSRPWNEACNWSNLGNCPSRTAVDQNFDAYVANRAFGNQGTVVKIANAERDCVDRNMNGVIDTSRDLNGNGVIDRGTAEIVGPTDECILWTVAAGGTNAVPRALAIGVATGASFVGDVWVGLYNTAEACRLSPTTGALIGCVSLFRGGTPFNPYGAAAYRDGRIFFGTISGASASPANLLVAVDPVTMTSTWTSDAPGVVGAGSYGMAVDGNDNVWIGGWDSRKLKRYHVPTDTWSDVTPARAGCPAATVVRGVAADATYIWATDYTANVVWQVRISDNATMNCWPIPATVLAGAGVSFDGSVWAISTMDSVAVRIAVTDPVAGTGVTTVHPVGLHPYTYSDFIGYGLNTFAEPRGYYRYVVTGCDPTLATRWQGIRFMGEVPPMTAVELFVRSSSTIAGLAGEAWIGPFIGNPVNLQAPPGPVPDGAYLEVEIRLRSDDRTTAPRIFTVDVAHTCIQPG
ncbi:MAG: PQQ-like beta-propeller repeat protein [Deltaproteobacteria bacterium]|nr:PQQ-like beta-propeller repeat protein [Deltaproteobacteria bacterium]